MIAALALSWLSVTAYAQNDLVISNVRVFTGQEQIEKASIVVNGGKITEISAAPATGRVLIDGEGKTALPGLIDSHAQDRKSTRLNSSHLVISYAVFCLKKKKKTNKT